MFFIFITHFYVISGNENKCFLICDGCCEVLALGSETKYLFELGEDDCEDEEVVEEGEKKREGKFGGGGSGKGK